MDTFIDNTHGYIPVGATIKLSNTLKIFLAINTRPQIDQIFEGFNIELQTIVNSGVTHSYRKGEIIFREGGIPNGVFIINKGFIKNYKFTSKGEDQIHYVSGMGELFGYHAILGDEYYSDSASTLEDSQITFIPRDVFLMTIQKSAGLNAQLVRLLAREFNLFINSISTLSTRSVRERLAINLLILDEKYKNPGKLNKAGEINLSRSDLANMVGTAKENLVRILAEFKLGGLIHLKKTIIVIANKNELIKKARLHDRKAS